MPTPPHTTYQGFALGIHEVDSHYPEDLPAKRFRIYRMANKLVVQTNTGGVHHYFTLDLTATSNQSLVYSATPP